MYIEDLEWHGDELSEEVSSGLKEWRLHQPTESPVLKRGKNISDVEVEP